ncbi:MAG TPA: hypothetical protein VE441_11085 [Mycobacterium sp.]|jgi:hypothetical protein|nr:hypothetical protein [Mycobacterium sp.]
MYGVKSGGLAFTGVGTFMILGHHFGVIQLMITAIVMMVAGVLLYRIGTRKSRFNAGQ